MSSVLAKIVEHKAMEVAERKQFCPLPLLQKKLENSTRSLKDALSNDCSDFILECKKASPSKGLIRENFDLDFILDQYKDFASAISVLTDNKYFQGEFSYLTKASQRVDLPILCKDFFIDPYQVYEARYYGADAILLMLSVLDDEQYRSLTVVADKLNLDILTEVHDQQELERALALNAQIIGINNRNLKDLSIDLATTEKLTKYLANVTDDRKSDKPIVISESGISNHSDVKRLAPLVNGFLIGSSIMAEKDIRTQCKALIYGNVKICGITRTQDAMQVDKNGGIYAGFVFYPKSKRFIDLETALSITQTVQLRYAGVFVDEQMDTVIDYAKKLKLFVVQLHGNETPDYIAKLKTALPETQIWKAVRVTDSVNFARNPQVDRYLLDAYSEDEQGGTGTCFNWKLLLTVEADDFILAGGVDLENIQQAISIGAYAIDLSSGVEIEPGIKCTKKITNLFKQLRV